MTLAYEEGKEKSEVKFQEINNTNISYMSDGNEHIATLLANGPIFENSIERQNVIEEDTVTETTNKAG